MSLTHSFKLGKYTYLSFVVYMMQKAIRLLTKLVNTRFDDTNTRSLIQEMSMEERKMFEFDGKCIEWEDYIVNVHLPGLKRELFQERSS